VHLAETDAPGRIDMTATPTGEYHCGQCGALFETAEELGAHRLQAGHSSVEIRGHRCEVCGERFADAEELQAHRVASNHASASGGKLECPQCGFELETAAELQRHREVMHFRAR
jgi:DNA-directed RNA polymerase subunit RPC12/RpoP